MPAAAIPVLADRLRRSWRRHIRRTTRPHSTHDLLRPQTSSSTAPVDALDDAASLRSHRTSMQRRVSILQSRAQQLQQQKDKKRSKGKAGTTTTSASEGTRKIYVQCLPPLATEEGVGVASAGVIRKISQRMSMPARPRPGSATAPVAAVPDDFAAEAPAITATPIVGESFAWFPSNRIRTSKYTAWSFIPKNLFEQFRRAANIYFLFMAVLQTIPYFGVNNLLLVIFPITFVLTVTAIKDGFEDKKRHQQDRQMNEESVYRWQGHSWRNVHVPVVIKESYFRQLLRRLGLIKLRAPAANESPTAVTSQTLATAPAVLPVEPASPGYEDAAVQQPSHYRSQALSSPADATPSPSSTRDSSIRMTHRQRFRKSATYSVRHRPLNDFDAGFHQVLWQDLHPGDIVYLPNNASIPADIVVLASSSEDGECFVETKNLDGETNLKPRKSIDIELQLSGGFEDGTAAPDGIPSAGVGELSCWVECDPPSSNLYAFNGTLYIRKDPNLWPRQPTTSSDPNIQGLEHITEAVYPATSVDISNMLLRGCVLRNTNWVIGLVIYTGHESKIMLNSGGTPSKQSRIERTMNKQVIFNFCLMLVLCVICAVANAFYQRMWLRGTGANIWSSGQDTSSGQSAFLTFWASLIAFQNIIPISLYISIEFVKTIQAFFINQDLRMYYAPRDASCVPRSWNLSDDLGQVEFVFSDKTGTLTRNIMEFRRCFIAGKAYGNIGPGSGSGETDAERGARLRGLPASNTPAQDKISDEELTSRFLAEMQKTFKPVYSETDPTKLTFADWQIFADMQSEKCPSTINLPRDVESDGLEMEQATSKEGIAVSSSATAVPKLTQSDAIREFYTLLAVCHTVVIDSPEDESNVKSPTGDEKPLPALPVGVVRYKAESPDENALVAAARDVGFVFLERKRASVKVNFMGTDQTFEQLHLLPFDSTRKRMSVIVRRPAPYNDIVLYCKGADNVILERLTAGQTDNVERTMKQLEAYSNDGLRTLLLAYKIIPPEAYEEWAEKFRAASSNVENRDELVAEAQEDIERGLWLLGATAIEDKLQERAPECIAALRHAGIKVWVLTGDKLETAINIGFASELVTNEMTMWTVRGGQPEDVIRRFLTAAGGILGRDLLQHLPGDSEGRLAHEDEIVTNLRHPAHHGSVQHALVIDGLALKHIFDHPRARRYLLRIAGVCRSVICCRVSPLQKAQVVHLVRRGYSAVCLAIGDGANDVSMIQEADIGVAITGEEGLQAAMASDYTIAQFRFLQPLLLIHGFWSYLRIAEMILNFFYKNILYATVVFFYQILAGFSANIFYDYTYVSTYNLFFTALPVLVMGIMDQAVDADHAIRYPALYSIGIRGERYTTKLFLLYVAEAIAAAAITIFCFQGIGPVFSLQGYGYSMFVYSMSTVTTVIIIANLFVGLNMYAWNWLTHVCIWLSVIAPFIAPWVFNASASLNSDLFGVAPVMYGSAMFWFCAIISIVFVLGPRFLIKAWRQVVAPSDIDVIRERQKYHLDEGAEFAEDTEGDGLVPSRRHSSSSIIVPSLSVSLSPDAAADLVDEKHL